MSEAAIVLSIIAIVTFTLNVAIVCSTAENIAKMKYGKEDPEEEYIKDLEKNLAAIKIGVIRDKQIHT